MSMPLKKLLIISDSTMCYDRGIPYAFGPVVMEIHYFLNYFEEITWIGRQDNMNPTFYELPADRVHLKLLPRIKAKGWKHKLGVLFNYPTMLRLLKQEIRKHETIHVRAPSHPALLATLLAKRYRNKLFWFKYAGSWVDPASRMYDLQRERLKRLPQNCVVTINGIWENQPDNILSFENPCLTSAHRKEGRHVLDEIKNSPKKTNDFCFVGGWNSSKGILPLLRAWKELQSTNLGTLHIIGKGEQEAEIMALASESPNSVKIHGLLPKEAVHNIYSSCLGVVLPTKTEGFPKVIGEAMNYGCLPIVTDVSCIGQYIKTGINGVLLDKVTQENIGKGILKMLSYDNESITEMQHRNYAVAEKFTYDYFLNRIQKEIFPSVFKNQNSL